MAADLSLQSRGYAGRILFIDLEGPEHWTEPLPPHVAEGLLGGRGVATWLWYHNQPKRADALSPDNHLIVFTGPLTGTTAPTAGRFGLVTKSPATGSILDSYCGGPFGQALKYAGYDCLVVRGRADQPSVLVIEDERVSLKPAGDLWGATITHAERALKAEHGPHAQALLIGPAGEWGSLMAGVFSGERAAGRGGAGAVMGAKNLKAIVAKGSGGVRVWDREGFAEGLRLALRALRMSSAIERLSEYGTSNILEFINVAGALPTRNFQAGQFEGAEELFGERWRQEVWAQSVACWGCPIHCSKLVRRDDYTLDGPDYETVYSLGSTCGISDRWAIVEANHICDEYGLDTISAGNAIGFAMELFQRGYVTAADLDGIEATWGNAGAMLALLRKMAVGEGVGRQLGMGVRRLSQKFPGSEDFAMHVKGLEMPAYHPNAAKGMALGYAVAERGACHLHGAPLVELLGGANPLTIEGKADLVRIYQSEIAVIDSAVLCYFTHFGMSLKELWQLIVPATGFDYARPRELEQVGQRISTLARLCNLREGFTRADDTLPKRALRDALGEGPAKCQTVDLEPMLDEYYALMEWDSEGRPTQACLERLEMGALLNG
jgi:aldehyde:ferredoxin oxidoreductase